MKRTLIEEVQQWGRRTILDRENSIIPCVTSLTHLGMAIWYYLRMKQKWNGLAGDLVREVDERYSHKFDRYFSAHNSSFT